MAFLTIFFAMIAAGSFSADSGADAASAEDLAKSDSHLASQTLAADDNGGCSGSLENSAVQLLTNRRKALSESSTLADVSNEDVVSPLQETVLSIKSANSTSSRASSQCENVAAAKCVPQIGLSYADSTPCPIEAVKAPKGSPNVIFLVLDDIGYGSLGCFGGPVDTPNIDRLAEGGLRYSNFHTTGICSPTRACMLTGRNLHSVSVGSLMEFASGFPGYTTYLSKEAATMPEMLVKNGYDTYCVGKWHLAPSGTINAAGPYDQWPMGRGFERFYGFLESHTSQWYPDLVSGTTRISPPATPEEGYHLSKDLVNQSIQYISDGKSLQPDKPFFLYLAFGAGHWPHHVPQAYIEKYKGKFDMGWDAMRNTTLTREKELGVVPENTDLAPRDQWVKAWDNLTADEKKVYARLAEVHAAYIDFTDEQIGRLLDYLKASGQLNNTMIVVISDNGASPEGDANGYTNMIMWANFVSEGGDSSGFQDRFLPIRNITNISTMLSKIDEIGGPLSYPTYPLGWSMADNTPNKLYKWTSHEGGTHDPMIIYWPDVIKDNGSIRSQFCHVIDIVPTVLEVINLNAPEVYNGVTQKPIEGISLAYTFANSTEPTHKIVQYFEMMGTRAIWYNGWKAVAFHHLNSGPDFQNDTWELYNLSSDISETHNLADKYPARLEEMQDRWWAEASKYNVLPLDDRAFSRYSALQARGISTFTYLPGVEKIMEPAIPDTRNSSYTLTAYVNNSRNDREGVLFSIGGRFAGLSLYVKDKHLIFDYNLFGLKHYIIRSENEVPAGYATLGFEFDKTGRWKGTGRLSINGKEEGSVDMSYTVPGRYSFDEGLEVGQDPQTPVTDEYSSPFKYNGGLEKVVMTVAND
ncbi:MAG: Sulfatase [Methanosaeta sp. PtaU1.Bin112]|nr:MAG: Sulfatase [Methanosaeta sp. PtaU1.Bin112]